MAGANIFSNKFVFSEAGKLTAGLAKVIYTVTAKFKRIIYFRRILQTYITAPADNYYSNRNSRNQAKEDQ